MFIEFLQEATVMDERDLAVKLGGAMFCGTVGAALGAHLTPALGSNLAIFIAAAIGYFAGTWLMHRIKRQEND